MTATGKYSCLTASLSLSNLSSYTVCTVMVPIFMYVIVSWLALWLRREEVLPRLLLLALCLFSISSKADEVNSSLPPVAYTKAIDVWTGTCIMFVFCALLEVITVAFFGEPVEKKDEDKEMETWINKVKNSSSGSKLDMVFRILYPIVFLLFSVTYIAKYST
jgi:anionic glutamate receptor